MDKQKRQAFINALILRASTEGLNDIKIVKEPRLNGSDSAYDPETYFIALYPKTVAAYEWLIQQNGAINKSGRVEPFAEFCGKLYLHDDSQKLLNGNADVLATDASDAFGAHRPFALSKLPSGSSVSIAHIEPDRDAGGHAQALVIATPLSQQNSALEALRKDGILPKKDALPLPYDISTNRKSASVIIAVPIASKLAQSLSVNPHNAISDLRDALNADLQKITSLTGIGALLDLRHSEKEISLPLTERRPPKEETETPALPSLASKKSDLLAIGLSLIRQPLLNGGKQSILRMPATASISRFTDGGKVADPLIIQSSLSSHEGAKLYTIGKEELARLESIIGTINTLPDLPLDTKPLEKVFKAKQDVSGKSTPHISHAYFVRELKSDVTLHHVYLSGERISLVKDVMNRLQLGNRARYLSEDNEKPTLVRFSLPVDAWNEFQDIAKDALGKNKLHVCEFLDDTHSLQSIDNELRETLGVRINREPEPVEEEKSPKDNQLSKDDAIQTLFNKLSAFTPENMLLAETHDEKTGQRKSFLYVRALTRDLNRIPKALKHSPEFKDAAKLVAGNKQEGNKKGLLRIALSDELLSKVNEQYPTVESAKNSYEKDSIDVAIKEIFERREQQAINRDAVDDAWNHLATRDVVAVRVSAPNKKRLESIQHKISAFKEMRKQWNLLPDTFDAMADMDRSFLKSLRKEGEDEYALRKILTDDISLARKTSEQLQDGFFARIEAHLHALEEEYKAIVAQGVHTEYMVLNPDDRSKRLLQPLMDDGTLRNPYQPAHARDFLRFTPQAGAQFTTMLAKKSIRLKNAHKGDELPVVSADNIEDWAANIKAALAEKAQREKPTSIILGAAMPDKNRGKDTEKKEPNPAFEISNDSTKSIQRHLAKLSGLLTWERQEPADANLPTQSSIGKQAVLAISVATQDELNTFKLLHQRLQDADLLLETPRFYGEIKSAKDCSPEPEENLGEAAQDSEEKINVLTRLESSLETITYQQKIGNNSHSTEEEKEFARKAIDEAKIEIEAWLTDNPLPSIRDAKIVALHSPEWRKVLEIEDYTEARRLLRAEIKSLKDRARDVEPAQPYRNPFAPKSTNNNYMVSVIKGSSDVAYPVDGRAGSGKDELRFDTWRRHILQTQENGQSKGIPALKLYLKPEAASHIAELMERGRSHISNNLESSEIKAATVEDIANRLFHLINPSRVNIAPLESSKTRR